MKKAFITAILTFVFSSAYTQERNVISFDYEYHGFNIYEDFNDVEYTLQAGKVTTSILDSNVVVVIENDFASRVFHGKFDYVTIQDDLDDDPTYFVKQWIFTSLEEINTGIQKAQLATLLITSEGRYVLTITHQGNSPVEVYLKQPKN